MDLTAQVPLLTVKLANHYESLAVHSDRSQVGFLMNLAYFMAAAGDRKKTEMGVATCRDHTPLWYCTMWAKLSFCWFTVRYVHGLLQCVATTFYFPFDHDGNHGEMGGINSLVFSKNQGVLGGARDMLIKYVACLP